MTLFPSAVKARENWGPQRIRGGKTSHKRISHSAVIQDRAAYAPGPKNPSEQFIADLLRDLRLKFDYECREFHLTLTGKGKLIIKPDFYIRAYDVFLEVTQGNEFNLEFKRAKIRNAHQLYPGVTIVLIGPQELARLNDGHVTLLELIEAAKQQREAHDRSTNVA